MPLLRFSPGIAYPQGQVWPIPSMRGAINPADGDFASLQTVWENLAKEDPLWAILSVPSKKGRKWTPEDFFLEGQLEVDHALGKLLTSGYPLSGGLALDFGCGVGRLTQPLADYFEHVIGVDISPTMLDLARQFNRRGSKVEYIQNAVDNLHIFSDGTFDFIYSKIVLQHMQPEYAVNYIREFFRIAKPGASIMFQVPSHLTDEYLPRRESATEAALRETVCRAAYRLIHGPTSLEPGEVAPWEIEITNASGETWMQQRRLQLNLANHWLLADRKTVAVNDDGRSRLPGRLRPGETAAISLDVQAPSSPGEYYLEIDVVQEGVRWFKNAGSPTLLIPIQVAHRRPGSAAIQSESTPTPAPAPVTAAAQAAPFMMEGVPKDKVLALIAEAGARLVATEEHVTEWYSYEYYIVR